MRRGGLPRARVHLASGQQRVHEESSSEACDVRNARGRPARARQPNGCPEVRLNGSAKHSCMTSSPLPVHSTFCRHTADLELVVVHTPCPRPLLVRTGKSMLLQVQKLLGTTTTSSSLADSSFRYRHILMYHIADPLWESLASATPL
jgi:hypothetical protein